VFALLALAAILLLAATRSDAAEAPYEPNDSIAGAVGPLAPGGTYAAALEREGDRDLFFFYMTSPNPSSAEITVTNLGGGSSTSELDVAILSPAEVILAGQSYIHIGQSRSVAAALEPGKYYAEVDGGNGLGSTSYNFTVGGGAGAFGPYAQIAARCASATKASTASDTSVNRAEAKLQRTRARLQRARYGTAKARESARRAFRKAKARLKSGRRERAAATEGQELWCAIPQ
jgi:hypothetical protein